MSKRVFSIALALALLTMLIIPTQATVQATRVKPSLSFNGTTASCSATVKGSGEIIATLELWQGSTLVASWSGTGTVSVFLHGTATVLHGQTYTLTVSGTVGGVEINAVPVTRTCP